MAKAIVVRKSAARKGVRVRLPAIPNLVPILRALLLLHTPFSKRRKNPTYRRGRPTCSRLGRSALTGVAFRGRFRLSVSAAASLAARGPAELAGPQGLGRASRLNVEPRNWVVYAQNARRQAGWTGGEFRNLQEESIDLGNKFCNKGDPLCLALFLYF